jgi:multimeric flavodoxin WrbA
MKVKNNIIMLGLLALVSTVFFSCGNKKEQDKNVTVEYKTGTKSVLIISSSPRRGGNSEILCEQFKKGAEEARHQVEMINLNDFDIKFYASAEYTRNVESVVPDDAIRIIRKMAAADVIVLASPVYFHSMTGQMKTLIDRVYAYEKDLSNKEFYYIITATDNEEKVLEGTIEGFRGFIRCLYNATERGIVKGYGARESGTIRKKPEVLQQAYEMGKGV